MNTRKTTFILIAAFALLVIAGTKVSQLTRTRSLQETSRFLVSTQDATSGRWSSRYITAPDLATNLGPWITNISSGSGSADLITNENQFGASTTLTIKSGAEITNTALRGNTTVYGDMLASGPGTFKSDDFAGEFVLVTSLGSPAYIAESAITETELLTLSGIAGNIATNLAAKMPTATFLSSSNDLYSLIIAAGISANTATNISRYFATNSAIVTSNNLYAVLAQKTNSTLYGTVTIDGATASEVAAFNASKQLVPVAGISPTELGFIDGLTENVQDAIDSHAGLLSRALTNGDTRNVGIAGTLTVTGAQTNRETVWLESDISQTTGGAADFANLSTVALSVAGTNVQTWIANLQGATNGLDTRLTVASNSLYSAIGSSSGGTNSPNINLLLGGTNLALVAGIESAFHNETNASHTINLNLAVPVSGQTVTYSVSNANSSDITVTLYTNSIPANPYDYGTKTNVNTFTAKAAAITEAKFKYLGSGIWIVESIKQPLQRLIFGSGITATTNGANNLDVTISSSGGGYTLFGSSAANSMSLADSTTYYAGLELNTSIGNMLIATNVQIYVPRTGTLKSGYIHYRVASTLGSSELITNSFYNVTTTTASSSVTAALNNASVNVTLTGLSLPVTAGDFVVLRIETPAWVTNPLQTTVSFQCWIE